MKASLKSVEALRAGGPPRGEIRVVLADRARARILRLSDTGSGIRKERCRLEPLTELIHAEARATGHARYTDASSNSRPSVGVSGQAFDDHRERADAEHLRRFARTVVWEALHHRGVPPPEVVILVAEPGLMGVLRKVSERLATPRGPAFLEYPHELIEAEVGALDERLVEARLLSPRRHGPRHR